MDPEKNAPGWDVRCCRCGFTEPWGKYGIRIGAWSWKCYKVKSCPSCHRFGFHALEKRSKSDKGKDWIQKKKDRQRRQGKEVREDSKYSGRKRKGHGIY